jgi:hypothetical protein
VDSARKRGHDHSDKIYSKMFVKSSTSNRPAATTMYRSAAVLLQLRLHAQKCHLRGGASLELVKMHFQGRFTLIKHMTMLLMVGVLILSAAAVIWSIKPKWKYICQGWKNEKIQVYGSWTVHDIDNDSYSFVYRCTPLASYFIASSLSSLSPYSIFEIPISLFFHHYLWSLSLFHPPPHSLFVSWLESSPCQNPGPYLKIAT